MRPKILIVAGEASADLHGAHLIEALKKRVPGAEIFGVGGKRLLEQGVEVCVPAEHLNVVGGADWFDKISEVLRSYRNLKAEIRLRKPDLAILLDLPDFNLRLSKFLKRLGVPTVYFISPQVWAWRKYRVRTIRRTIRKMLVVFPFEKDFYDAQGVDACFVGHPLLDQVAARKNFRTQSEVASAPRIALLPGSRQSELRAHAGLLGDLARKLRQRYPGAQLKIPVASTIQPESLRELFPDPFIELVEGDSRKILEWADLAMVASGTATLETAIIGTPFCLFYKLSASTAWVLRNLIRYKRDFGMPNLLLKKQVFREFVQEAAIPSSLFQECERLIQDENYRKKLSDYGLQCRRLLGEPGATDRAAEQVFEVLQSLLKHEAQLVPSLA